MIEAVSTGDSNAVLKKTYPGGKMASPLFERIGKSITKAKAPTGDDPAGETDDAAEESDESPGAMLAEALGIPDADAGKVDEALRRAIRSLK